MGSGLSWHHASCVVVGEAGILIRGPSGCGKSTLARSLLARASRAGCFAALVGDDRIGLRVAGGRLIASGHPSLTGLIEVRGTGLAPSRPEPSAVLRLLVECGPVLPRLPDAEHLQAMVEGVCLPRHVTGGSLTDEADLILWRLRGTSVTTASVP